MIAFCCAMLDVQMLFIEVYSRVNLEEIVVMCSFNRSFWGFRDHSFSSRLRTHSSPFATSFTNSHDSSDNMSHPDFRFCLDGLHGSCPTVCAGCGKENKGKGGGSCSKCRAQVYCSTACQKEDWPHHKQYCSLMHNILDFIHAAVLQPLRARPIAVSGEIAHTSDNCAAGVFRTKSHPTDSAEKKRSESDMYPELMISNLEFAERGKKSSNKVGERLAFLVSQGVVAIGNNYSAGPAGLETETLYAARPFNSKSWSGEQQNAGVILAAALGLEELKRSCINNVRECVAREPWFAFPGLSRCGLATESHKLSKRINRFQEKDVSRRLNAAAVVGDESVKLATSFLPIAIPDAHPSLSQHPKLKLYTRYAFPWEPEAKSRAADSSLALRLFALRDDRILSLYFWVAGKNVDPSIGLQEEDQVHLVDLNLSTGLCRILSSRGWHLSMLKGQDQDKVAEAYGKRGPHVYGSEELWPEKSAWPADKSEMFSKVSKLANSVERMPVNVSKEIREGTQAVVQKLIDDGYTLEDLLEMMEAESLSEN